ncbi:MAG: hypothetical protein ACK5M3_16040, partial [Dysgonomonas sp.]
FLGCSSDDDFDLIINESDLTSQGVGLYYKKDDQGIFILKQVDSNICAGSSSCPNKNYSHKYSISLGNIDRVNENNVPVYQIYCGECKSVFYLPSGKPVESGKGNVEMYNVSYNKDKTYRVWK